MTPDSNNYLIMGSVVFSVIMALYLASLWLRARSLKQDIETLEELEKNP